MPLMTKIRESLSTVFAVFAGVFVVYIVLDWGMDITGRKSRAAGAGGTVQEIGTIDGENISFKDFSDLVRQASDNQKKQSGTEPDENQLRAIRDQVWNQLVDDKIYAKEAARLGIKVTDQEIIDWVKGDNPPDFLRQQYTDSTGSFNRQRYEADISNPKNRTIMITIEDYLRKQRTREKLQSLVLSTIRVSDGEVLQKFKDQNIRYDGDYVYLDANTMVKDDEIKITDDDLRKYYNDHTAEYKIDPTRKLKYVMFNEAASRNDTDDTKNELNDILKRANAGSDFKELAKTYSEVPPSDAFINHGELTGDKGTAVFDGKAGNLIGPINDPDGYHLIKIDSFKTGKDDFVRASHILISIENNDSVKALKEANDIVKQLKSGADFAALAAQKSKDPGSAAKGGDLGWFGKGRMVKPFEDAAFKSKIGQVAGPVKSQFGYHILKVTGRDNRLVRIIDLKMSVHPSAQTKDALAQQAQDFAYLAKQNDFTKTAEEYKYSVLETPAFQKNAFISGIGMNSTLNKFAFSEKVGKVGDAVPLQSGYVVAVVSDVNDTRLKPFDEVKSTISDALKLEKKIEKLKPVVEQLRQSLSPSDSLGKLTLQKPNITVQRLASFTASSFLPAAGKDLGFFGGIEQLKPGELSPPIKGSRGYFIAKLQNKSTFDSTAFNAQKDVLRSQLMSERKNRILAAWSESLKKAADIVDNRDQYFR
ncbi:MAG: peptidylprolyl isomerase [Bacteroidota bacterium]